MNIKNALSSLQKIGEVTKVAPFYKTASWGFDGNEFLNTCVEFKTNLSPFELLENIHHIEKELGRKRTAVYTNRTIDIDILLFDNEVVNSENLIIPHAKMLERNFVLAPLADITKTIVHPVENVTIETALKQCTDLAEIKKTALDLSKHCLDNSSRLISIEGNIGAGKTSLSKMLATHFDSELVLEGFSDNPFLPRFYKKPKKYAFQLETSFLLDRNEQLKSLKKDKFTISDYHIYKSLIFAKNTLSKHNFKLYKQIFDLVVSEIKTPDLYVYLNQTTDRLLENIKKRGRVYEKDIKEKYLERVNQHYLKFIDKGHFSKLLIIDCTEMDFVNNENDFLKMISLITEQF